ncbi:Zinc finger, C2H2 [Artemisia annua]|uniref:Zinc finger, C2H2 n=1 Tax=Artemisia annua TaxID=35608 RepID=A0A2U1MKA5_ARTAN|nr:Zinc finger, C2H2 [Artemisia annua]
MPVAKLLGANTPDAVNSVEGNDSIDTFLRQAVGKQPLFSFSRTEDSPTQWIQLLHSFDQPDLTNWPLLAPMKPQMQKCDKCAREFCSPVNYRRHIKVHRRSKKYHKALLLEPQKYRDFLGAFWDKLAYDEAQDIMSLDDVNLEEVPGSSIVNEIAAYLRKPNYLSLTHVYWKAGSALLNIIQGRPPMLPVSSKELFSVLDDASERTFLCAGTAESLQKFVFNGEAGKIVSELRNLFACASFLVEQKLVKAWLADKDAEALRCQKLLVEEEEAAQRRQADLIERKRRRKIRQKEQRARDHSNRMKADLNTAIYISESIPSSETSGPQTSPEVNPLTPDEYAVEPLNPAQFSSNEEAIDIEAQQKLHGNGSHHFNARWQVQKSQRGSRNSPYNNQNGNVIKWEQTHKHREQRVHSGKIWTKRPKSGNVGEEIVKSRVNNDAINETRTTVSNNCQLMIGSISVTVRTSTGQHQVNSKVEVQEDRNAEVKTKSVQNGANRSNGKFWRPRHDARGQLSNSQAVEQDTTSERGTEQTVSAECHQPVCNLNGNDHLVTNDSNLQVEDIDNQDHYPFSIDAAKAFLSQRWKEAISGEHVELVLTSAPELPGPLDCQESDAQGRVVGNPNGQLAKVVEIDSPVSANVKPKFRTWPDKNMKIKYIPKNRVA